MVAFLLAGPFAYSLLQCPSTMLLICCGQLVGSSSLFSLSCFCIEILGFCTSFLWCLVASHFSLSISYALRASLLSIPGVALKIAQSATLSSGGVFLISASLSIFVECSTASAAASILYCILSRVRLLCRTCSALGASLSFSITS